MNHKVQKYDYVPCIFECERFLLPPKWQSGAWLALGIIAIILFEVGIYILNIHVNIFTAIYFVGGIGWIPASLCWLSHSYYKCCQSTFCYLDVKGLASFRKKQFNSVQELYKYSAELIFGYVTNKTQRMVACLVWLVMFITIIFSRGTTAHQTLCQFVYMGFFYCIVGFVFTSVICAVIGFVISLVLLGRCNSSEHALYDGIVDQLREDRHSWVTLDWCIVPLFVALAIAMGLSPYGTSLWLWLPFLSAFPILLFIICHNTTKKLMQTALKNEDKKWTNLITEMIESADKECHCTVSLLGNCNYISCPKRMAITEIYSVLSIRDYFQRYIQDRRSLTEWFLFLFTLLGAAGSVLGATYDIWTNEWNLFFDMCKQMF